MTLRTLCRNTGTRRGIEACSSVFLAEQNDSARCNPILATIA